MSTQPLAFTQATQAGPGRQSAGYATYCDRFLQLIQKYQVVLGEASQNTSQIPEDRREKFVHIFDELENKQRYQRLFEYLAKKCDQGELLAKMVEGLIVALPACREPSKHRRLLVGYIIDALNRAALSGESYSTVEGVLRAQLAELEMRDLNELQQTITASLLDGTWRGKRTFDALVAVSELMHERDPQQDGASTSVRAEVISTLYQRASATSYRTVAELAREVNETSVFAKYTAQVVTGDEGHELETPLTLLKIVVGLNDLSQDDLAHALEHFTKQWNAMSKELLTQHIDGFALLKSELEKHPKLAQSLLKLLKRDHGASWESMFALICALLLCSTKRHSGEAVALLSHSLSKLWKHEQIMRQSAWIRKVVANSSAAKARQRCSAVLELVKSNPEWFALLAPALDRISSKLMLESARSTEVRIVEGRLFDSGDVAFLGRRIFVEIAVQNVDGITDQLRRLIDATFAASDTTVAYLLADILLEITARVPAMLLNATEAFGILVDNVCELPADVGVVLIRAIQSVLNHRPELKQRLFQAIKLQLRCPSAVPTALPILLLLWKSVMGHPSVASGPQLQRSQSFATFSSQTLTQSSTGRRQEQVLALEIFGTIKRLMGQSATAQCLIYQGLLSICQKLPVFSSKALDLLLPQVCELPALDVNEYVQTSKDSVYVKVPIAHTIKTVSILYRLTVAHSGSDDSSQGTAANTLAARAEEELGKVLDSVASKDLEDLALDKATDFGASSQGQRNVVFARMMIRLYDVLIEHIWRITGGEITLDYATTIERLLHNRDELHKILLEKTRQKDGDKAAKGAANAASAAHAHGLQCDMEELESMLHVLISTEPNDENQHMGPLMENILPWVLNKLNEQLGSLDPRAVSGATPLKCYESIAKSLIHVYLGDDNVVRHLRDIALSDPSKTIALACYARIFKYTVTRYGPRSASALNGLLDCFSDANFAENRAAQFQPSQMPTQLGPALGQGGGPGAVHSAPLPDWKTLLYRHYFLYANHILTPVLHCQKEFLDAKRGAEFQRQVMALFELCTFISKATPNSTNATTQETFFKLLMMRLQKSVIEDKKIVQELCKAAFGIVASSSCGEYYTTVLAKAVEEIKLASNHPEDSESGWKSLSVRTRDTVFIQLALCLEQFMKIVRQAIQVRSEMESELDEEFMANICEAMHRFALVTEKAVGYGAERDSLTNNVATLATQFYETLNAIFKKLEHALKSARKEEVKQWQCIEVLAAIITECVVPIRKNCTDGGMGAWIHTEEDDKIPLQRKIRDAKQAEKVFVTHEKALEAFVVTALTVSKLSDCNAFDLKSLPTFRCFQIVKETVIKRMERRPSGESDEQIEEEEEPVADEEEPMAVDDEEEVEDEAVDQDDGPADKRPRLS